MNQSFLRHLRAIVLFIAFPVIAAPMNPAPDKIIIHKAARTLTLMHKDSVIKTYSVSLGNNPVGKKEEEGDGKTPEGKYTIERHNPKSKFHLALRISYPNAEDTRRAHARGKSPGGDIMIHGLPNGYVPPNPPTPLGDWTLGCIALTNPEIEEIYDAVKDGTSVEIFP